MNRRSPRATQRDSSTAPTISPAADLLQQLAADAPPVALSRPTGGSGPGRSRGRSGGIVDAPGKKHRPPMPSDPGANRADSQAAKVRAAKPMVKTSGRRGRG